MFLPALRPPRCWPGGEEGLEGRPRGTEAGDAEAQYLLGESYYYGLGRKNDEREGVRDFDLAASQGFLEAQFRLGECCSTGSGSTGRETPRRSVKNSPARGLSCAGAP